MLYQRINKVPISSIELSETMRLVDEIDLLLGIVLTFTLLYYRMVAYLK